MEEKCEHQLLTRGGGIRCAPPGGAHDTANVGPRTVPVRSGLSGVKTLEFSGPPRPIDVLRAGTARAPVEMSRCTSSDISNSSNRRAEPMCRLGFAGAKMFRMLELCRQAGKVPGQLVQSAPNRVVQELRRRLGAQIDHKLTAPHGFFQG